MLKTARRPLVAIALVIAALIAVDYGWLHLLEPLERRFGDALTRRVAAQLAPDPDIVIVDIDEASLARLQDSAGRWPWPRAVHAELLAGLLAQQPRAVVFDILFAEPDVFRPRTAMSFFALPCATRPVSICLPCGSIASRMHAVWPCRKLPHRLDCNAHPQHRVVESAKEVMARGLDKNDEYEADRLGVQFAARAGYDPFGLPSVLQMLAAVNPSDSAVALMFSTHPPPSARLDAIEQSLTPELEQARPRILSSDEFRTLVRAR